MTVTPPLETMPRRRWADRFTPRQHVLGVANILIQILLLLLVGWMVYLTLWPRHGLVFDTPMVAEPATVRAGQVLTVSLSYRKDFEGASELGLFLASSGRLIMLPTATMALPAGTHRLAVYVPVPAYTPPGSYKVYLVRETHASYFPRPPLLVESTTIEVVP